jgi:galactokinase
MGAVAARMTGGGFGGSIVALVAQAGAQAFGEELWARYNGRFATNATVRICFAGAGAGELT